MPRLPLRPPTQLDSRHRPETQKHKAPCTKTSVWTPGTAEAAAISAQRHLPGQHHAVGAELAGRGHVGTVGHAGLRAEVELQLGILRPQGQQGRVADQHRVGAGTAGRAPGSAPPGPDRARQRSMLSVR